MSGNERTIFGNGDGVTDGRAVTDTDLNAISVNLTRRAWEMPGYAYLMAYDLVDLGAYGETFKGDTSPYIDGRKYGVFTIGGGLRPYSPATLASTFGAGMLGIWKQTTVVPPAQNGATNMLWLWAPGGNGFTHDAEGTGYKRWDIVTCTITEENVAAVARDFEDAATGDKTSENVVTAVVPTVAFSVSAGTHSNSDAETIPATPSGQHLMFAVHVDEGAIDKVIDFTIPFGRLQKIQQPGGDGIYNPAHWNGSSGGEITSKDIGASSQTVAFFPPGLAGKGDARLLGIKLAYSLAAGASVILEKVHALGGDETVLDISDDLTIDGTLQKTFIDLRANPIWGTGTQSKGDASEDSAITLNITTASDSGTGNVLYYAQWYFAE